MQEQVNQEVKVALYDKTQPKTMDQGLSHVFICLDGSIKWSSLSLPRLDLGYRFKYHKTKVERDDTWYIPEHGSEVLHTVL